MGPYGVFVTENQSLFFDNVVLNTAHEVHLHIRNIGQIATEIQCTITAEHNVFSVNPDIVNIEPFTSTTISLIFTPSAVDVSMEIRILNANHTDSHLRVLKGI